jgi:SagB-type dehydrogenase family enzyme
MPTMSNRETSVCREYAKLILNRGTGVDDPLIPANHTVDWNDQPSRFKIYRDSERILLSDHIRAKLGSLQELGAKDEQDSDVLSFETLSHILLFSNGILRRKLNVNWNLSPTGMASHLNALYSRPAASGGGLYPSELYLVTGKGRPLLPGIFHYDNAHHALERLYLGDATEHVRQACSRHRLAVPSTDFILISVNFWKNYFKYADFCYHVVTQDAGAIQAALHLAARALGVDVRLIWWFEDEQLNRMLGLNSTEESILAVAALGGDGAERHHTPVLSGSVDAGAPLVPAATPSYQRSKHIFPLPHLESIHRSTLLDGEPIPELKANDGLEPSAKVASSARFPLPGGEPLARDLIEVLLARSSSWGNMRRCPPTSLSEVASLLRFVSSTDLPLCDVAPADTPLTRLMLIANHVEGLPPGVYSHDSCGDCLWQIRHGDVSRQLQRNYFLQNYNLEQSALVIAVVGNLETMFTTFGNRGLRVLNGAVGMAAQRAYLAAASLSIGCGAILGFSNRALNGILALEGSDETALLLLLVGHQVSDQAAFDFRLI